MSSLILNANALQIPLADNTVRCVITSPPYWGKRDYNTTPQIWSNGHALCETHKWVKVLPRRHRSISDAPNSPNQHSNRGSLFDSRESDYCANCGAWRGELGNEPTVDMYVAHMLQIFREVHRVLKPDGTVWLNLGDSFVGGKGKPGSRDPEHQAARNKRGESLERAHHQATGGKGKTRPLDDLAALRDSGLKPKDLVGVPWRVALALQADGWYLRSDIIWYKPNPMPYSGKDRPTCAHEYIFLLSKSRTYYYDYEAILEPAAYDGRKATRMKGSPKYANGFVPVDSHQTLAVEGHERWPNKLNPSKYKDTNYGGDGTSLRGHSGYYDADGNLLTYTKDGVPARNKRSVWRVPTKGYKGAHFATYPEKLIIPCVLAGSREGDIILDPFSGSGTTGKVALAHHRRFVGLDINPSYIQMAQERIGSVQVRLV